MKDYGYGMRDEQDNPCYFVCPICLAGGNEHCSAFCKGRDCMWYVAEKETCAVTILAEKALERSNENDE